MTTSTKFALVLFFSIFLFSTCKDKPIDLPTDEKIRRGLKEACGNCDDEYGFYQLQDKDDLDIIPQDRINNPLTEDKVRLGKLLFHETGLAVFPEKNIGLGTYSCATCHYASAGFQAKRIQAVGDGGIGFNNRAFQPSYISSQIDVQAIRSPSLLNSAYQDVTMWNGALGAVEQNAGTDWDSGTPSEFNLLGYEGLETRAISGIIFHRMWVDSSLIDAYGYDNFFNNAFPNFPISNRYTVETAGLAIAAYLRTIVTNESPFQKWLKGDRSAMNEIQKQGANLFFGKANCVNCHNGPALNGWTWDDRTSKFKAIGLSDLYEYASSPPVFNASIDSPANLGRGGFTKRSQDFHKFKIPQLYNLKDFSYYGHGGSLATIRSVVEYKNNGEVQKQGDNLDEMFRPLELTEGEMDQLVEFLEVGLYDESIRAEGNKKYQPDEVRSGNCIPNNDLQSRADLGCD